MKSKNGMKVKKRAKVPLGLSRSRNSEKIVTKNLLDGFVSAGSKGEKILENLLGCPLNQISLSSLIAIATVFSEMSKIKLERNFKRKKDLIVKWFNDNEEAINFYRQFVYINYS